MIGLRGKKVTQPFHSQTRPPTLPGCGSSRNVTKKGENFEIKRKREGKRKRDDHNFRKGRLVHFFIFADLLQRDIMKKESETIVRSRDKVVGE